jgi:hypothetical protein
MLLERRMEVTRSSNVVGSLVMGEVGSLRMRVVISSYWGISRVYRET